MSSTLLGCQVGDMVHFFLLNCELIGICFEKWSIPVTASLRSTLLWPTPSVHLAVYIIYRFSHVEMMTECLCNDSIMTRQSYHMMVHIISVPRPYLHVCTYIYYIRLVSNLQSAILWRQQTTWNGFGSVDLTLAICLLEVWFSMGEVEWWYILAVVVVET